ncbi:PQQ-dependent sugar dehydrogenase [Croceicoccus mobilis]|uniref:Dehydrogenase n=1 Tax=Croceicoccus mobilis TaxID=1703339 RepID=A0A917DSP8_9SPHN|nr:PQQ-dependent sugar dehydrogenase [Croceicoccus mobilis]GGD67470.1 dehydrogenase [Croceicoccus mobilis]
MNTRSVSLAGMALVSLGTVVVASCSDLPSQANSGDVADKSAPSSSPPFDREDKGTFDEPWAMAFEPGTNNLFVTLKKGEITFLRPDGTRGTVSGVPEVDYGGQGGLGDFRFAPDYESSHAVYLSWAEAGDGDTRGAAVARATMLCGTQTSCELRDLRVIWRQSSKVTGRGHYSHRIAFSPDGEYLFIASGDRQKKDPAQDLSNNLGTIVRLLPDGTPASGNPFAERGGVSRQIWSYGHRNILGLGFDKDGQLWDLEHGPQGGDELNLVTEGGNYGWPNVSNGVNYGGGAIPDHSPDDDYLPPAEWWDPVIAPGDMMFYSGALFPDWQGDAVIAGLASEALVLVRINGTAAKEQARYPMGARMRALAQAPDGAIWAAEDGPEAHLWRLTPVDVPANAD